jgi:cytochrome c oxidase subunit 2
VNRDTVNVFFLWLVLMALGEFVILGTDLFTYPIIGAEEGHVVDDAFFFLTALAVPVAAFVLSMLGYTFIRFRVSGPEEDGPPVKMHRSWAIFWLVWTTGLTLFVIVHPGITGILEIRHLGSGEPDLVVETEGSRWYWTINYPDGVTVKTFEEDAEMVLPVDSHVKFEVTSTDVLHAFWVPAFRMKVDAVPGLVTTISATTIGLGNYRDDPQYRLQCAELCGLLHNGMDVPVRVVSVAEFDAWLAEKAVTAA